MTPHEAYIITLYVRKLNLAYISNEKRSKIPLSNKQEGRLNKVVIQLWQNLYMRALISDVNNTPKINAQSVKDLSIIYS